MAKHHALVDEYGNRTNFVGDHVGQNRRGDDYYVKDDRDARTLVRVDNRDGAWIAIGREAEINVIRGLFVEGERDLADRLKVALDRPDEVSDSV
jgi:hypothetical protein